MASSWSAPRPGTTGPVDPTGLDAARTARLVADGSVTAEDVVRAHLERHAEVDPALNALVLVDAERALDHARDIDSRQRHGESLGPLAGVPVALKDNIDVRGQTTANGSLAHGGVLALRDAAVLDLLRRADAVLLGRSNMDELAMGASTQTSAFGPTRNPWDPRRSPGGSSGGSAAALASRQVTLSVGTDTGGSVREPASQCGVVGMTPSRGLVPIRGVVPFAPDLDRVGPLSRTVAEAALLLSVLADDPSLGRPLGASLAAGLRIGVVEELCGDPNQPGVLARFRAALTVLEDLGATLVPVSVPEARRALSTYMTLTSAACVPWAQPYVDTGAAGAEVLRRFEIGSRLLRDQDALTDAESGRLRLRRQAASALSRCDLLASPTMPTTAPLLASVSTEEMADPLATPYTDCWTVVANLAGLPAISVPAGLSPTDSMPVGVMLAGPDRSDRLLLEVAAALEAAFRD